MNQPNTSPIQVTLTVSRKEYMTPHFIRIYLQGDGVKQFSHLTIGANNKILIPPKGIKQIHFPEIDKETGKRKETKGVMAPVTRTYTHRGIDLDSNEIYIDFVAHGDEGPASEWAERATIGDILGVMMKNKQAPLYPVANHYILAGDATAIPVLSAILESLPATAKGTCIIEVHGKEDEQTISTNANIDFIWLHNPSPQQGSELANVLKQQALPTESRFAYIAAEFSSVKAIRHYLRKEQRWERNEVYAFSYWKSGVSENASAKDRRKEMMDDNQC